MREILFRGKRVDNGEWIEGCLVIRKDTGNNAINCYIIRPSYVHFNNSHIVHTEVNPDTVCEYSGLKDNHGNKIFENDIVQNEENTIFHCQYEFITEYKDGAFIFNNDDIGLECFGKDSEYLKIIGNKFDNPELV